MSATGGVASSHAASQTQAHTITGKLTVLFAVAVGVIVTNLFAPQTLIGLIGPSLGMSPAEGSLVAMTTLLGYAAGLFLLVPLADLAENRRLIALMLGGGVAASVAAVFAPGAGTLLGVLFVLGACCSAIQILVPIAASMAAPERRGRVIGDVMSGLMVGILLARPMASFLAGLWGWRAFYAASAAAMVVMAVVLVLCLPRRQPAVRSAYLRLIASLWHLLRGEPALRRRSLTASLMMAAFSLFWTSVALRLAQPPFDLGQRGIALFALAGAGGAVVTPLFGWLGDRGWTRAATLAAHFVLVVAALLAFLGGCGAIPLRGLSLAVMVAGTVLIDVAVTGDQTLGRRVINLLQPEARGRLNGLFVGLFFLGGAAGSGLAGLAWTLGGWHAVCAAIALMGGAAIMVDWVGGRSSSE